MRNVECGARSLMDRLPSFHIPNSGTLWVSRIRESHVPPGWRQTRPQAFQSAFGRMIVLL